MTTYLEVTPTGLQLPEALTEVGDYGTIVVRKGVYSFSPMLPTAETWTVSPYFGGAALILSFKKRVRIIGEDAVLKFTPGSGLCIYNCEDIDISGLTFVGTGYTTTPEKWYFALVLLNGTNTHFRIHHCEFQDSGNHGIGHLMGGSTDDSEFDHNRFERGGHLNRPADIDGQSPLGGDGAALAVRGSQNLFHDNIIIDWLRGIEIEAKDNEASDNVIEDNELRNVFWHGIFVTPTGRVLQNCRRNIIRRNVLMSGPGMGSFTMAHPIYIAGGGQQIIHSNIIYAQPKDWCGIDCTANYCDLSAAIIRNRVFGAGRFGIGLGFNGNQAGTLDAAAGWNEIDSCGGAGIGYQKGQFRITGNRIGQVIMRDGVQQPIYSPDDKQLSCCWDNQT